MLDCAILVHKTQYVGPNYSKIRITWFNKRGMCLGITETIKINKSEYKNWHEFEGDNVW
jgi:hypothetical protein